MRLIDFFDKGVDLVPDRDFLIDDNGSRTYREVQLASNLLASGLRRRGINAGARAAVYSHNTSVAFESLIGVIRAGCIWVSANVRNSIDDTIYILNNTSAEVLFYSSKYEDDVRSIQRSCPSIKLFICIDAEVSGHLSLKSLVDAASPIVEECDRGRDDIATLFSSGGTTGTPKGIMMTNLGWATLVATIRSQLYHEAPVHLVVAPMTHAAGGFMLAMAPMGTTNVILPEFNPLRVMEAIQRYRVTHLFLPPTAIYRLLSHPDVRKYDYSSLRYFTYSAAPMAPEKVKEAISVFGPVMTTGFGQTEAGLNVTFFSPQEHMEALASGNEARLLSCGRASMFARVEIMNNEGVLLQPGQVGEIVVRSDQLMLGYWNNDEETRKARAFGWHHTGDLGYKDADGWVFLVDRKRDLIISGGFNVFPAEVEKVIMSHPAIQDCVVVGSPDPDWGEAVTAVVQLKDGATATNGELRDFCRARLGGVKAPKKFETWPELPRSPVGKLLRRKVREHFWQDRPRSI